MKKHILVKSDICSNAKDVVAHIEREFGLFQIDFSQEFEYETGYTEHEAYTFLGAEKFRAMREEVINSLKVNLTQPAVIMVVGSSLTNKCLSELGFVYDLGMSNVPALDIAESIFDNAAEYYCAETAVAKIAA